MLVAYTNGGGVFLVHLSLSLPPQSNIRVQVLDFTLIVESFKGSIKVGFLSCIFVTVVSSLVQY